jgi:hypothetical protein
MKILRASALAALLSSVLTTLTACADLVVGRWG